VLGLLVTRIHTMQIAVMPSKVIKYKTSVIHAQGCKTAYNV
jgi:hypothetical protein